MAGLEPNTLGQQGLAETELQRGSESRAARPFPPPICWLLTSTDDRPGAEALKGALASIGCASEIVLAGSADQNRVWCRESVWVGYATQSKAEHLKSLDALCSTQGIPWVRCVVDSQRGIADSGPCFWGELGLLRLSTFNDLYTPASLPAPVPALHTSLVFWAHMLAPPLVELCRRLQAGESTTDFLRFTTCNLKTQRLRATSLSSAELAHPAALLKLFEDVTSRAVARPTHSDAQRRPKIVAALPESPNSRSRPLPNAAPLPAKAVSNLLQQTSASGGDVNPGVMSALLLYSNGRREDDRSHRQHTSYAANAGNLNSCMVSFLTCVGQQPRLFHYRSEQHDLLRLEQRKLGRAIRPLLGACTARARTLLFWTGNLDVLYPKYGAFAYRLVLLDCGVAFSQAALLARGLGLRLQIEAGVSRSEASLLLNLRTESRHLMLTASLDGQPPAPDEQVFVQVRSEVPRIDASEFLFQSPEEMEQRLRCASLPVVGVPAHSRGRSFGVAPASLPDKQAHATVGAVLNARKSTRSFARQDVPEALLETLVAWADTADRQDWPNCESGNTLGYDIVRRGMPRLHLRCSSEGGQWVRTVHARVPPEAPLYVDACFNDPPAAIWISGDFASLDDPRSYEELMIRAGAAANRIWLLALEAGLCGAMAAGLLASAKPVLQMKEWHVQPLCATILGYNE